jgi:hypothetical protein
MRRSIVIALLALGTVAGFTTGAAHLHHRCHHHRHDHCFQRHHDPGRGPDREGRPPPASPSPAPP